MPTLHKTPAADQIDLVSSFWLAAHWIWERRQTAKQTGLPFSEETITETVLLDLATQNPREILVFPFNKRREGKTGADWEWCIYNANKNRFMRMLVQAKVLDDLDDEYSHIDRKIGNSGTRQIDQLLTTARERGVPALYAFYNHLADKTRVPLATCKCYECLECWGVSVTLALAVDSILPDKTFDTLRAVSMPWICLLCPGWSGQGQVSDGPGAAADAVNRLLSVFKQLHPVSSIDPHSRQFVDMIRSEPPSYFARLFDLQHIDSKRSREVILEQVAAENPNIDGIVLLTNENRAAVTKSDVPG